MGEPDGPLPSGCGPAVRTAGPFFLPGNDSWAAPPNGGTTHVNAEREN